MNQHLNSRLRTPRVPHSWSKYQRMQRSPWASLLLREYRSMPRLPTWSLSIRALRSHPTKCQMRGLEEMVRERHVSPAPENAPPGRDSSECPSRSSQNLLLSRAYPSAFHHLLFSNCSAWGQTPFWLYHHSTQ